MPQPENVVIRRYLDRLLRTVKRGGLLNASPTRSVKRLDLMRFGIARAGLPNELVSTLLRSKNGKVACDLDLSRQELDPDGEAESPEKTLYHAVTSGLLRTAEAFKRETGVRSLWLAYPLFYARVVDGAGDWKSVLSPVFLWPIKIETPLRTQGRIIFSRDVESGGPKYNKALDLWITENLDFSPEDPSREEFDEISRLQLQAVVSDLYAGLKPAPAASLVDLLQAIPDKAGLERLPTPSVLNAGVIGLIQWENQALTHDLERLLKQGMTAPLVDDFLCGRGRETRRTVVLPPENDRFLVTEADPAQERAVWLARDGGGLVVHGPPGTGKSQTIVNMVTDSLAHGQRVLVVCQKRAAVDVVAARLKAQGLGDLFCVVHDSEADRTHTILGIKNQIQTANLRAETASVAGRRTRLAGEIEKLEAQLGEFSASICGLGHSGLAYRDLLAKAARLCADGGRIPPNERLKSVFRDKTLEDLNPLEGEIKATAETWSQAKPNTNPWRFRRADLTLDPIIKGALVRDLETIAAGEAIHAQFVAGSGKGFPIVGDPFAFQEAGAHWLGQIKAATEPVLFPACAGWLALAAKRDRGPLDQASVAMRPVLDRFTSVARERIEASHAEECRVMGVSQALDRVGVIGELVDLERKWWRWFSPRYHGLHKRLRLLLGRKERVSPAELLRLRESLLVWLDCQNWALSFATELLAECDNNPWFKVVAEAFARSDDAAVESALGELELNVRRAPLAGKVVTDLACLKSKFKDEYVGGLGRKTCAGDSVATDVESIRDGLQGLESLQMLDLNRPYRDGLAREVLGILEDGEAATSEVPDLPARWWHRVQIAAVLSWKEAWEEQRPILRRMSVTQFEQSRQQLAKALEEKRHLEVEFICEVWHARQSQRTKGDFNGILVTRGPNSKRLRQVVELGQAVGLFDFRPCWLTNPNTASQIFPLTEGFFDLVIFDEASQCPIEQAIPAICRAKRVVVAGDGKQLPPTSFFQSGFSFGDTDAPAEVSDEPPEAPVDIQQRLEEASRDQAMAVTDLLEASKPLLCECLLNIHYRSEHPALISFSNHAFYGGQLQIPPAMHRRPAEAPLLLMEVNGVYDKKRNLAEARKVIDVLRNLWLAGGNPPTVGVVTFNEVQRDLIEDMLLDEAAKDVAFQARYVAERNRVEHDQDVGFFVKNLESVQGDERDVMIFSTTFGRDPQGQFRRFFGPINLQGGERRLNVAITRAKKRNYVVTSMPLHEISNALVGGGVPVGVRLSGRDYLHAYMQYVHAVSNRDADAQKQTLELAGRLATVAGTTSGAGKEESLFEAEVRDAITALGYQAEAQVGESGFRIDLAVLHPDAERGYLLGVECDGKAYHSEWSARARDVWRQQILERRGWRIHRVWSTNWWNDREGEIRRLQARIRSLLGI